MKKDDKVQKKEWAYQLNRDTTVAENIKESGYEMTQLKYKHVDGYMKTQPSS
jgi:hypothetical protein